MRKIASLIFFCVIGLISTQYCVINKQTCRCEIINSNRYALIVCRDISSSSNSILNLTDIYKIVPNYVTYNFDILINNKLMVTILPNTFSNLLLNYLDLRLNQIRTISERAFQKIIGLKELNLNSNKLESVKSLIQSFSMLNLSQLGEFNFLHLSKNRIKSLDELEFPSTMQNLFELDLSFNKIEYISNSKTFLNLKRLTKLDLSQNPIRFTEQNVLPFSLTEFYLRNSYLNSSGFLNNNYYKNLQYLNVTFSSLREIDISSNLIELNVQSNNIVVFRVSESRNKLKILDLSSNYIEDLDQTDLRKLTALNVLLLDNNRIDKLNEKNFKPLLMLSRLSVDRNKLKSIDVKFFSIMPNLKELYLKLNSIEMIVSSSLPNELVNVSRLQLIDLSSNFIRIISKEAFMILSAVKFARLDNNFISFDSNSNLDFDSVLNLYNLKLSNNFLTKISSDLLFCLKKITILDLSYNQIDSIEPNAFDNLTQIYDLNLYYNRLARFGQISTKKLENLAVLNLKANFIENIDSNAFLCTPNLKYLYLDTNKLYKIENEVLFKHVSGLIGLDLSGNYFQTIRSFYFKHLTKLKYLHLATNQLSSIEDGSFANLHHLEVLDLHDNFLFKFDSLKLFSSNSITYLTEVYLNRNDGFLSSYDNNFESKSLTQVTTIHYYKIEYIKDFEFAFLPSLTTINLNMCSVKRIGKLAFKDLPYLEKLFLKRNFLVNLNESLIFLSQLLELDLSFNQLENFTSLDFRALNKLIYLNIESNKIKYFEANFFAHMSFLSELRANNANSPLNNSLANLFYAQNLYYSENVLQDFDFLKKFKYLKKISLMNCALENRNLALDQINLPYLEEANFAGLKTSNFSLSIFLNLRVGVFTDLDIEFIDDISELDKLETLDLSINKLKLIRSEQFAHNLFLKSLNLSFNLIETVEKDAFRSLSYLEVLILSSNAIKYFDSNTIVIANIFLDSNMMTNLDDGTSLLSNFISKLMLKKNGIQSLPYHIADTINSVDILDLSDNNISCLRSNFTRSFLVFRLELARNQIATIDSDTFFNLRFMYHLGLSENKLTHLHRETFFKQTRLRMLNLSHNFIQIIQQDLFSSLKNIEHLDLSHNSIKLIESFAFQHFAYLENLFLNDNNELVFEKQSKTGLYMLKLVYVSEAQLKSEENRMTIQSLFDVKFFKLINQISFFRSISITFRPREENYTQETCKMILNFIRLKLHLNLNDDNDFKKFQQNCFSIISLGN